MNNLRSVTSINNSFPKICNTCKKIYENEFQFFKETTVARISGSYTKEIMEDEKIYLEVYRNCICGSTLMEFFGSERDVSEQGIRRRIIFEKLLLALEMAGNEKEQSRSLLIEFILTFSGGRQ